jgi:hypothetical protein
MQYAVGGLLELVPQFIQNAYWLLPAAYCLLSIKP